MENFLLIDTLEKEFLIALLFSLICGPVVGCERERRNKPAVLLSNWCSDAFYISL